MSQALLIIDLQRALCVGEYACHDVDAVIARINGLIARASETGTPVVFVQHEEDAYEPLRHGSDGWQIDDRLHARPDDPRIFKTASDSFHRTELDAVLKGLGASAEVAISLTLALPCRPATSKPTSAPTGRLAKETGMPVSISTATMLSPNRPGPCRYWPL